MLPRASAGTDNNKAQQMQQRIIYGILRDVIVILLSAVMGHALIPE